MLYIDDALDDIFTAIAGGLDDGPNNIVMHMCCRHDHVPVLHIRDARYNSCKITWSEAEPDSQHNQMTKENNSNMKD